MTRERMDMRLCDATSARWWAFVVLGTVLLTAPRQSSFAQRASRPRRPAVAVQKPAALATPVDTAPTPTFPMTVRVGADTVTVGEIFSVVVAVDVPATSTVQWPVASDSTAPVAMRGAPRVSSEVRGALRRETATYAFAAWDVGAQPIRIGELVVRGATAVEKVAIAAPRIAVETVLPRDTALHVPKPARDLFPRVVPWWEQWWPAAAVVAALALLFWLWRRMRRRVVRKPVVALDLFARAMHDFDRLQRLALVDGGERGRAVALATEVLRSYLAGRISNADLSKTSEELLTVVESDSRVPHDRLDALLSVTDHVKFAHRIVSPDEARALHAEARAIVELVESREQARRKLVDEEREAREAEARAARADEEDAARRKSRRPKAGAS